MTAQMPDYIKIDDLEYIVIGTHSELFNPISVGLIPSMRSTNCYKGFWNEFKVTNKKLCLSKLYINTIRSQGYPPIMGRRVADIEYKDAIVYDKSGKRKEKVPKFSGHRVYDLDLPIKYTGNLLIGRNLVEEFSSLDGYSPIEFEEVYELVFDNGELLNRFDYAGIEKRIREAVKSEKKPQLCASDIFAPQSLFFKYPNFLW